MWGVPRAHRQVITLEDAASPSERLSYGWCLVTGLGFRVGPQKAGNVKTKIMSFSVQGEVKKRIRRKQAGRVY